MDKQCEELIYSVTEKIKRLMDYLVKAREAKKANGHFVQGRIMMFQDPNKSIEILTGNLAILEETLEKNRTICWKPKFSYQKLPRRRAFTRYAIANIRLVSKQIYGMLETL